MITTHQPLQTLCPACGYEVTNLPTSNGMSTCPECGQRVTPIPHDRIFTHKHLHKQLATNLLAPTAVPMLMILLATLAFNVLTVLGCLLIILYPAFVLYLSINQLRSASDNADSSPIKISKLLILIWVLLYAIPGILLFLYFMKIGIASFGSIA